jgi:hypothetical protein
MRDQLDDGQAKAFAARMKGKIAYLDQQRNGQAGPVPAGKKADDLPF